MREKFVLNKILSIFLLFLLFVSVSTFASAESISSTGSEGLDLDLDSEDTSDEELEDESKDELDDEDELEEESDDELESEDELDDEEELEDESGDEEDELKLSNSGPSDSCDRVRYVEKKLFELSQDLSEEASERDLEKVKRIKSEIESQRKMLTAAREACMKASPVRAAIGKTCEVPQDLLDSLDAIKKKYIAAIESKDFENAKTLREEGAKIDAKIKEARLKCASEVVPGLMQKMSEKCEIPAELYDKLERAQSRLAELEKMGTEVPSELKEDIANLEDDIAEKKAKCNALKVDASTDSSKVREYYQERLSQALDNEDDETKIRELKELRKEIDETIKNLVESKKKLRYDEVDGLVDEVKFKAKSTSIGDSETEEEVELEVEVEDSSVTIESGEESVLLTEGETEFTADDITVDENGIYVNGVLVKNLPSDVFEKNKNLERNAKKIYEMKLESDGKKAVYKAKYESKRKLLGFIGVNAKNEAIVDAETGNTISENKPWWNGLSTETKDEDDDSDSVETTLEDVETSAIKDSATTILNSENSEVAVA
jgi:hypothetical protein